MQWTANASFYNIAVAKQSINGNTEETPVEESRCVFVPVIYPDRSQRKATLHILLPLYSYLDSSHPSTNSTSCHRWDIFKVALSSGEDCNIAVCLHGARWCSPF